MLTKAYVHTVAFFESLKKDERGVTLDSSNKCNRLPSVDLKRG